MIIRNYMAAVLLLFGITQVGAQYVVELREVGSNVVATGSGSLNLTGLVFASSENGASGAISVRAAAGQVAIGQAFVPTDSYRGVPQMTAFGTGAFIPAATGTGNYAALRGVVAGSQVVCVPRGYVSGTPLTSSAIWTNTTFAGLGLTPGSYSTSWNGGTGSFTINVVVPTAAEVSVAGRVLSSTDNGLSNAVVTLTDAGGNVRTTRTSSFGYFRFDEIEAGQPVTLSVEAKQHRFAPRVVNLANDIAELEFRPISQ